MPDRIRRAPDIPGKRKGDAALSQGPDPSTSPAGGLGTEPPTSSGTADEVPTLATPTLAALYASQGHREMAAAIYAQLSQGGRGLPPGKHLGSLGAAGGESGATVKKLLALRQAARRRRGETQGANPPPEAEDSVDGR